MTTTVSFSNTNWPIPNTGDFKLYYMVDPISLEIRYVGVTKKSLKARLTNHIVHSRKSSDHKSNWIKKLARLGMKPEINTLQTFATIEEVLEAEKYWINYFRSVGCDLTNTCEGGKPIPSLSEEVRKKISKSLTGKKASEETRKKLVESHKGQHSSPATEFKKGQAAWNKGKKYSNPKKTKPIIDSNGTVYLGGAKEASEKLGIKKDTIKAVAQGRIKKTSCGLQFLYLSNEGVA